MQQKNETNDLKSVLAAVSSLNAMIKQEQNHKVWAIYSAGNIVLSSQYKNFQAQSHVWHS